MFKLKWMSLIVLGVLLLTSANEGLGQGGEKIILAASITSSQEVPIPDGGVPGGAVGTATMLFDPSTNTLQVALAWSGLSGPAGAAHFHNAAVGSAGGVVQTICGSPDPALAGACSMGGNSGFVTGTWQVPGDQVGALLSGELYINVHTGDHPAGEIRGQVLPQ